MSRTGKLPVAVFVDVDGTLVGPYREGRRQLRSSASEVLAMLAQVAPVFVWSIAGADNGTRLLKEFPALSEHVAGSHAKSEALLEMVERPFAIDDEAVDEAVLSCRHFIVGSSYFGGDDDGDLLQVAHAVIDEIRAGPSQGPAVQPAVAEEETSPRR